MRRGSAVVGGAGAGGGVAEGTRGPGESSPAPPRCPRAQDASSSRWPGCRPWPRSCCCSERAKVPGPRKWKRMAGSSRTRTPSTCIRPTCSRTGSRAPRTSSCSSHPGNCSSRRAAGPDLGTGDQGPGARDRGEGAGPRRLCRGRGPRSGLAADVALAAGLRARKGGPRGETRKGLSAPPSRWSPGIPCLCPLLSSPNFLCWPDAAGARRPRALAWRVLPAGFSILCWIGNLSPLKM